MSIANRRRGRPGFTLVELLVVIAIIALLVGLTLPAVQKVREAANRTSCANNLKQIGLACLAYELDHHTLPPSYAVEQGPSWMVMIWPYIEQEPLFRRWDMKKTYYDQADEVRLALIPIYFCPSRRSGGDSPRASLSGDCPSQLVDSAALYSPDATLPNFPGGLSDYAGSLGMADT
jgi:prepilin-type N-terminal cleavage/methylation domain-containing protein